MTVPAAVRELEKIEMVRRNSGRYRLDHAVSKKQKIILNSFGMSDEDIRTITDEISILLDNNKSLMYEADTDDEDEEEEVNDYGTDTLDFFD